MPHTDAKTALARALRDALTTTPLSKVTVSGLTRAAGVTRQAFYYHFSDIRDLTVWVFKREVGNQVATHSTYDEWSDGLLAVLGDDVLELRGDVEEFQIFLYKQLHSVMEPVVDELSQDLRVTEGDRVFIADHFTLCVLGHVSQWLASGMSSDPYILTERISRILDGQVLHALTIFTQKPTMTSARA